MTVKVFNREKNTFHNIPKIPQVYISKQFFLKY